MTPDIAGLTALAEAAQGLLWEWFVVALRVGAVVALMPAFGEVTIPARVKLALVLAFTAIVAPAVGETLPPPGMVAPLAGEVAAGLLLGMGLRILVLALMTAGAIAGQTTSLAQIFAPAGGEVGTAVGAVLVIAGLAVALATGLHLRAAAFLIESYRLLPPGGTIAAADAAAWGVGRIAQATGLALSLAAPFAIAAFLYNLALGVINRAMPQLMVAFVGAPALALGTLALAALALPLAIPVWVAALSDAMADPLAVAP